MKLQPRSTPCVFLGYSTSQSAYKCYDPASHKLYISRHVQFVEHEFPLKTMDVDYSLFHGLLSGDPPDVVTDDIPPAHPIISPPPQHSSTNTTTPPPPSAQSPTTSPTPTSTQPTLIDTSTMSDPLELESITPTSTDPPSPTPATVRPTRHRKPNPKYFGPAFVNKTTIHPLHPAVTPSCFTQAHKLPE